MSVQLSMFSACLSIVPHISQTLSCKDTAFWFTLKVNVWTFNRQPNILSSLDFLFVFLASGDSQQRYWDIQLDRDLLETICSIYPEWFKDCNMNLGPENNNNSSADLKSSKHEENNQKSIDKNKECEPPFLANYYTL